MNPKHESARSQWFWLVGVGSVGLLLLAQVSLRTSAEGVALPSRALELLEEALADTVYTLYLAPSCEGCDALWTAVQRMHDAGSGAAGSPQVLVRVLPADDSPRARVAALSLECARIEGRFWEYVAVMLESPHGSEHDPLIAGRAGIRNLPDHADCVSGMRLLYEIEARYERLAPFEARTPPLLMRTAGGSDELVPPHTLSTIVSRMEAARCSDC